MIISLAMTHRFFKGHVINWDVINPDPICSLLRTTRWVLLGAGGWTVPCTVQYMLLLLLCAMLHSGVRDCGLQHLLHRFFLFFFLFLDEIIFGLLSWDSIALWLRLGGGATIWCCSVRQVTWQRFCSLVRCCILEHSSRLWIFIASLFFVFLKKTLATD